MADIRPFPALRYNLERVAASQVVTQPYDKITPAMQEQYYAASPYNLVRIILGRREAADNTVENVYSRAAGYGRKWREEGILVQDSALSIYSYSQIFTAPSGKQFERRGFIALGRVEDYSAKVVYRHEQTLAKPKADRLDLLRATRTHYEQLFLLYEDSGEIGAAAGLRASGRSHHRYNRRVRSRPPRLADLRPARDRFRATKHARQKAGHRRWPSPLRDGT